MNIYVGNLSWSIDDQQLEDLFKEHGEVTSARVITDRFTKRSRGFGFVEMANDQEALDAIENLDGFNLLEREMRVNQAKPRDNS